MTDTAAALQAPRQTTDALNMMELPRRVSAAEIDDFTITADLANGRVWLVEGEAIARFAAMTNWDYYEATLRFQKVLDSAGEQLLYQYYEISYDLIEGKGALSPAGALHATG